MTRTSHRRRLRKKPIAGRFLGATCAVWVASAQLVFAQALDEAEGVRRVCESGPDAQLSRARRLSGLAYEVAAGVLPNPSLVVEHERALSGATEHETVLGISVPLGLSGRRSLLQDAASARKEQATSEADSTLFESALEFRRAYAAAVLDRARADVLAHQQEVFDQFSATLARLAQGGEAAGYDLLRQRLQAQLHRRSLESARARAAGSLRLLEAWLGSDVTLPDVSLLDLAGGSADERAPTAAAASHPDLRALEARARASEIEARAAERRWVPDLEVFAGYRTVTVADDTGHGIALSLRMPLTFFDHGQGEAAHARAEHDEASANAASLRRRQAALVQSLAAQLEVLNAGSAQVVANAADADTLQEQARQLYTAGEASITDVLEAFRATEEARLSVIEVAEEIAAARLAQMQAAGTQRDNDLDRACSAMHGRAP